MKKFIYICIRVNNKYYPKNYLDILRNKISTRLLIISKFFWKDIGALYIAFAMKFQDVYRVRTNREAVSYPKRPIKGRLRSSQPL